MEHKNDWLVTSALNVQSGQTEPFSAAIRSSRMAMVIADPRQPDCPIIYANKAFLNLSGYEAAEVVGRNCRFLQGPETNPDDVSRIGEAISSGDDVSIDILNYRKDGTTFWNSLYISPVNDSNGVAQYYFASQLDVTERKNHEFEAMTLNRNLDSLVRERTRELEDALETTKMLVHEVDHRVKNNLQMVSAMIMLQSMSIPDEKIKNTLHNMLERVDAMGLVHKRLYRAQAVDEFDISEFTREIADNLVSASGRNDIGLTIETEPVIIHADSAASIALVINETITNALKHAFPNGTAGVLHLSVRPQRGECEIHVRDNGRGMPAGATEKESFGKTLIETLVKQLRAKIEWLPGSPGTHVRIVMPLA